MRILVAVAVAATMSIAANARAQTAKPIVYVLSTGGTIAGSGSSSTDLSNYKPGSILGEQLVKAVPQISLIADVRVEQIVNVNSSDITIENWLTLAKRINAIIKETPAVAGFVITSGTNTLEETVYARIIQPPHTMQRQRTTPCNSVTSAFPHAVCAVS